MRVAAVTGDHLNELCPHVVLWLPLRQVHFLVQQLSQDCDLGPPTREGPHDR